MVKKIMKRGNYVIVGLVVLVTLMCVGGVLAGFKGAAEGAYDVNSGAITYKQAGAENLNPENPDAPMTPEHFNQWLGNDGSVPWGGEDQASFHSSQATGADVTVEQGAQVSPDGLSLHGGNAQVYPEGADSAWADGNGAGMRNGAQQVGGNCGQFSGGGGQGSPGGGAGAGAGDALFEKAMSAVQSFLSLFGEIKGSMQGLTEEDPEPVHPQDTLDSGRGYAENYGEYAGGIPTTTADGDGEETTITMEGTQVALTDESEEGADKKYVFTEPDNQAEAGTITFGDDLETTVHSNTRTDFATTDATQITVSAPEEPKTTVTFDPTSIDDYNTDYAYSQNDFTAGGVFGELLETGGGSLVGAVISAPDPNQFVKLVKQDLSISGQRIMVDIFRSFRLVDISGNNLKIWNGKSKIEFKGEKTLYPRRIRESPHNMHRITNKLDFKNYFRLRNDNGGEKNYLVDGKKVVSVGNKVISHPTKRGLRIARVRRDMWPS